MYHWRRNRILLDLDRAKYLLKQESCTSVFCKGEITYIGRNRGVYDLVGLLSNGTDLKGFSAADQVVGKAVALLLVLAKVKEVYAHVMSESAVCLLAYYGIISSCDYAVPEILNATQTEVCLIDQCVSNTKSPEEALQLMKNALKNIGDMC